MMYATLVKSSNEIYVMHETRFTKSSTKENDSNVGFYFQNEKFEDVTTDEVDRNNFLMGVNVDIEDCGHLQLTQKPMMKS